MITVVLTARDRDGNVVATHDLPENTETFEVSYDMTFVLARDQEHNSIATYNLPYNTYSVETLRDVTFDPPLHYTAGKSTINVHVTPGVWYVL